MKPLLGALYFVWVLVTTAFGAMCASAALYHLFVASGPAQHPALAAFLGICLFSVLFFQFLFLHLRFAGAGNLVPGTLVVVAFLLVALHFLR